MALAKDQITLINVNDGYVGNDGKTYVLNILGGHRSITYNEVGASPSPSPSAFSFELLVNGTPVTPTSRSWSATGHLSGTSTAATFTPTYATNFNPSYSNAVNLTVVYEGISIKATTPIAVTRVGEVRYTWIKYADTAEGAGISDSPTGKKYIGIATNKNVSTESNTPGDYTWSPLYDNVVVGGRNLIQRYGEIQNSLINSTGAITSSPDNSVMLETIPVTPGETLTFSKTTTSSDNYFRWKWMNASGVYIARTENNSNEFQWVVPANAASIQVSYPSNSFPQVERGNIATGWGLAPEDIERALGDKATSTDIDSVNELINGLIGDVAGKAEAGELEALREAYDIKVAQDLVDKAIAEGDLETLKGRTSAIENNLGARAEKWNFIETSVTMAGEGIFIGNNVTKMGVLVGTDRISFMDKDTEVAYISNKTMEITHGIFVKSAIIGKHKIETLPDSDITVFTFVG